jgi:lipoyl(octanoyl) transferase
VLNPKDIPVVQSDRGGEVTYHGPGQLVVYFLLDIKKLSFGPKKLVSTIQNFVKDLLDQISIDCNFVEGAPGVYVDKKKIASIGLRISKGYEGLEVTQIKDLNKDISKLQLEKLVINTLRKIF